ncbi:MAG TPA: isoprenylcysteine carboxylmethyltransferase family protein [Chryseosolibacter sp.]
MPDVTSSSTRNLWLKNLRDIIVLPFSVTCLVPYSIIDPAEDLIPDTISLRISGAVLMLGGSSLFTYTVLLFNRIGKGTLAPWSEKVKLVIAGPYRYCRNPMITGVALVLAGEALFFHSSSILIWLFIFIAVNTVYFLLMEEPALLKKFGSEYDVYRAQVPRWLPRLKPYVKERDVR